MLTPTTYPTVTARCVLDRYHEIRKDVKCYFFKTDQPQEAWRKFYPGLSQLGRHFTVKNRTDYIMTRQYTICNCMHPDVYQAMMDLLAANAGSMEAN